MTKLEDAIKGGVFEAEARYGHGAWKSKSSLENRLACHCLGEYSDYPMTVFLLLGAINNQRLETLLCSCTTHVTELQFPDTLHLTVSTWSAVVS